MRRAAASASSTLVSDESRPMAEEEVEETEVEMRGTVARISWAAEAGRDRGGAVDAGEEGEEERLLSPDTAGDATAPTRIRTATPAAAHMRLPCGACGARRSSYSLASRASTSRVSPTHLAWLLLRVAPQLSARASHTAASHWAARPQTPTKFPWQKTRRSERAYESGHGRRSKLWVRSCGMALGVPSAGSLYCLSWTVTRLSRSTTTTVATRVP